MLKECDIVLLAPERVECQRGGILLTSRQNLLLKMIIEEYIQTATPVGSKSICAAMGCSSATIRAEMSTLEELGLLEKTHISSGRVPSEKGYRYYVDNIMEAKELSGEDVLKLQCIMDNKSLTVSDVISRSMEIVAEMTNYTAVVLGNSSKDNLINKVEVIPIDEKNLVAIVVTDKGHVEHKNIYLDGKVSSNDISKTIELINKLIVGTPINEVGSFLEFNVKPIISNYVQQHEILYNAFYNAFSDFASNVNHVNMSGRINMLKQPEFSDADKIKEIISKFEDKELVNSIQEEDSGVKIYIGSENNFDDDVTIIKSKYVVDGEEGTIALIGPKRMDYDRAITLLNYINENINK